jgi:hypothetical protein
MKFRSQGSDKGSAPPHPAHATDPSKRSKVLRDMLGLHSLPSQVFIPHANEVARMAGVGR